MDSLTFQIESWGNISFGFKDMDKNNIKSLFKKNILSLVAPEYAKSGM